MQNIEYVCSVLENPIFTEGHTIQLESSLRKSEILGYNTASSENEYAVALMNGIVRWMMVKGAESYVYSALFDNASIVAHYHPPMTIAGALPDCRDVGLAATSMSRELIIHNLLEVSADDEQVKDPFVNARETRHHHVGVRLSHDQA